MPSSSGISNEQHARLRGIAEWHGEAATRLLDPGRIPVGIWRHEVDKQTGRSLPGCEAIESIDEPIALEGRTHDLRRCTEAAPHPRDPARFLDGSLPAIDVRKRGAGKHDRPATDGRQQMPFLSRREQAGSPVDEATGLQRVAFRRSGPCCKSSDLLQDLSLIADQMGKIGAAQRVMCPCDTAEQAEFHHLVKQRFKRVVAELGGEAGRLTPRLRSRAKFLYRSRSPAAPVHLC